MRNKRSIKEDNKKLLFLLQDQSSPQILVKVQRSSEYNQTGTNQDGIKLLGLIREVMCGVKKHIQETAALVKATKNIYMFWQKPLVTNNDYQKLFELLVTMQETLGSKLPLHLSHVTAKLLELECSDSHNPRPAEKENKAQELRG